MDLQQSFALISDYFSENDIYNPNTDYKKLNFNLLKQSPDDKLPQDWEIKIGIQAALTDMVTEDFVKVVETGNGKNKETNYLIVSSMKENGCNVVLSRECCKKIATVVDSMLPYISIDLADQKCNPKDIGENDIYILLEAINALGQQLQETLKSKEIQQIKNNNSQENQGE